MSLTRRSFLKGLFALPAIVVAPKLLEAKPTVVPIEVITAIQIDSTGCLDRWRALYGICRKPGESDESLRKRMLDQPCFTGRR